MMSPSALGALGSRVAKTQDETLAGSPLMGATRARVLATRVRTRRHEGWVLAACALAGAAVAAGVLALVGERPLRIESQDGGKLAFSDGSRVMAGPGSDVRINALHARGANIELARGRLQASIVHKDETEWLFNAGPFRVAIVGTKFDLQWDAGEEALTVAVHEGAIRISGCSIAGVPLSAGQKATLRCSQGETAVPPSVSAPFLSAPVAASGSSALPRAVASAAAQEEQPQPAPVAAASPSPEQTVPDAAAPDWRALAASGRLRDAYAAAEAAGFESECEKASGRELLELADAALLAGRMDRANAALLAARRRFPGSAHAAAAAYRLGRMAFDQRGALGDARNWFQAYLQEAPSGELAREAEGRLIEIDLRTGNVAAARSRAERYLRRYPDGPHVALARKVVAGP